ncbi:zf-HC2 domain-containing protein [Tumebacillus sp. ITR2]|uniref:Anti-sigma-W factor RsiW n=1 Tax=Tumebacillus amylolyticus TaxID=2801339 RepID=A0ABS1J8X5_9BACL|nr:zf-HC2 domain-containing protein [Tumebacillus amylolyticus]MBL0386098.1 zf-HC2 domain-containing protein [Tumebacillus amylolyticus]
MNTHLSGNLLFKYLEDDLDDLEREKVEAHLEVCEHCVEQLAEVAAIGADEEVFPLELPPVGFADRVMEELSAAQSKVVQLPVRRRSPKFEVFTRFVTAAAVTGFMMLGSYQAAKAGDHSVVNTIQHKVEDVSSNTEAMYVSIHTWFESLSAKIF